ncbi:hypothetical protein [Pimelobacter simplex]|uniref:hypothetical protein n=1 Tax=Nocardioides simplex TaxID=2045 RepID=UPI003AAC8360
MNEMTVRVTHDGVEYGASVMRIHSTMLGIEDHGIFTALLRCEGAGTVISVGGYALDAWSHDDARRLGTAYGMEHIAEVMRVVGVDQWEHLAGKDVLVLHEGPPAWGRTAVGIASLMGERAIIFANHAEAWRARFPDLEVSA